MCRRTRQVIAYAIGDRSQNTCRRLGERIHANYKGCQSFSDVWEAYQLIFPPDTHQRLEQVKDTPITWNTGITD